MTHNLPSKPMCDICNFKRRSANVSSKFGSSRMAEVLAQGRSDCSHNRHTLDHSVGLLAKPALHPVRRQLFTRVSLATR